MQYKSPLLQSLQSNLRLQHLSRRTETAYIYWTRRFVRFSGLRHPAELDSADVRRFLNHLVMDRHVSAATQQQALSALLFLYRNVVGRPLEELGRLPRGRAPTTVPVVLTRDEVVRVLRQLQGTPRLGRLSSVRQRDSADRVPDASGQGSGSGPRRAAGAAWQGREGPNDSRTGYALRLPLREHLGRVKLMHDRDLGRGDGLVELPGGLEAKYPKAAWSWAWQWVFPA